MSKRGHAAVRMCIGCRRRRKKSDLLRLTRSEDGTFLLDQQMLLEGRGFYLCPDVKCLRTAQKKNRVSPILNPAGSASLSQHWNSR